jgi:hypothetical protein
MTTRPAAKIPRAACGLTMTWGIAEKIRMIWPIIETMFAHWFQSVLECRF